MTEKFNSIFNQLLFNYSQFQIEKNKFDFNEEEKKNSHLNYFNKCFSILNSIKEENILNDLNQIKNEIKNRIDLINLIIQKFNEINNNLNNENKNLNNENLLNYKEKNSQIKIELNSILEKLENLNFNSFINSVKKAKNEYKNNNNSFYQNLFTKIIEKGKLEDFLIRELKSKNNILKEKEEILNHNKNKINKLTIQFNENNKRLNDEIKKNEKIQNEINEILQKKNFLIKNFNEIPVDYNLNKKIIKINFDYEKINFIIENNLILFKYLKFHNENLNKKIFCLFLYAKILLNKINKNNINNNNLEIKNQIKNIQNKQNEIQFFYKNLEKKCLEKQIDSKNQKNQIENKNNQIKKYSKILNSFQI